MTVIFAQGMRRSGTTILFDLFWTDRRFECWYEPLNRARKAHGGGSGARDVDYMERVVALREELIARRGDPALDQEAFNWGAPRAPELEFESGWPGHIADFVTAMTRSGEHVFVKFTRASHKVAELARIRPDAWFVHLVRDPRAVATSHIFRRTPEHRERILADGSFFTLRTGFDQWRAESMARHLVTTRPEYAHLAGEPAHVLVMLVWKELYDRTSRDAARHFHGRTVEVSHEALCEDPARVLHDLHANWGMKPPRAVLRWAKENVRPARPWHDPGNPEWSRALELLDLGRDWAP